MRYVLPCSCGNSHIVRQSQAGTQLRCEQCGNRVDVPTIAGFRSLQLADATPISSADGVKQQARWSLLRGMLATSCFLVALIGLGRAGLYGLYRASNPTPYSEEDLNRSIDEQTAVMSPAETWDMWRSIHESGLGKKQPPEPFVVKRFLEQQDSQMSKWAIVGSVALIGFFLATFVGLNARQSSKKG